MPFYLRTPEQSPKHDHIEEPILDKGKGKEILKDNTDTDKEILEDNSDKGKEPAQDNMAPHKIDYNSSRSSSEAERIYHDPRKDRRSATSRPPTTKRETVVHNSGTKTYDTPRSSKHTDNKWS